MNGLDSPLEALTFIPLNLGTVISTVANNLWAWLALFTATLSLWRLRTTTKTTSSLILSPPPPPIKPTSTCILRTTSTTCMNIDDEFVEKQQQEGVLTRGNSKKFFSVYFEKEDEDHHVHNDDDEIIDEVEENESRVVLVKRRGSTTTQYDPTEMVFEKCGMYKILSLSLENREDFGWYNYQNMKVIDGSVVRLWEDKRESWFRGGSPRSCRSIPTSPLVLA